MLQVFWTAKAREPFDIRELPEGYNPHARIERDGVKSLSTLELLTVLLGSNKKESALDAAGRVLALGSRLNEVSVGELAEIVGTKKKALRLLAALEFGLRMAAQPGAVRPTIRGPEDAAKLLMPKMRGLDREHFAVVFLDTKNQVIADETVAVGTLSSATVHPREVFKNAVKRSAAGIIVAHNHPSGDPNPSRQDIDLTKQLFGAGQVIGIAVLDHLIIGDGRWVSLKALGII